jgi:hypothetical protein
VLTINDCSTASRVRHVTMTPSTDFANMFSILVSLRRTPTKQKNYIVLTVKDPKVPFCFCHSYSVFQGFSYAKFAYGGSILSSSQFLILPQLPQNMKLTSKVVKIDPKIIVLLPTI